MHIGVLRYLALSTGLLTSILPTGRLVRHDLGARATARFQVGMLGTVTAQQLAVAVLLRRFRRETGTQAPNLVDTLTLSRGYAAAVIMGLAFSGLRDTRNAAGRVAWFALLYGAILCDWLDGPIARHRGTTRLGTVLDREADSWLTLCTAVAAVAVGNLPSAVAMPPLLRYLLMARELRCYTYDDLFETDPFWTRPLGIAQMLLFIGALAPFRGPLSSKVLTIAVPLEVPVQIAGLLARHQARTKS